VGGSPTSADLDGWRDPARPGRPAAEIAATGAFLRFDGAAYINGATIQIDGGRHMP